LKSPRGIVSCAIFARNGSVQEAAEAHVSVKASKVFHLIFANWHLILMGHRLHISLLVLLLISMILVHLKHLLLLLVLFESELVHHIVIVERNQGRMDYGLF
jgi:hypothetical protein